MDRDKYEPVRNYFKQYSMYEIKKRASKFKNEMLRRRTVRDISDRPVSKEIIEDCLIIAGSAPSGANIQPWHFVVIGDPAVKRKIRSEAEKNENEFYSNKATEEWLQALKPFNTNAVKPFLETAPYLIAVFAQKNRILDDGKKEQNYYVNESVGIATGFLITAIHKAGLASLTYSPSPMGFLNELLGRPDNERPFILLAVGFPADNAEVPAITKKSLNEIATFMD